VVEVEDVQPVELLLEQQQAVVVLEELHLLLEHLELLTPEVVVVELVMGYLLAVSVVLVL
jgi:hypothetical protein